MISEKIKELRHMAGYSQAKLARKLDVTRSSVNAWEMGFSTPTTQYVIGMCKLFHVTADSFLEIEPEMTVSLKGYSKEEIELVWQLLRYFDSKHS